MKLGEGKKKNMSYAMQVMLLASTTVIPVAGVPPIVTLVAPVRLVPVSVTRVAPVAGQVAQFEVELAGRLAEIDSPAAALDPIRPEAVTSLPSPWPTAPSLCSPT